MAARTVDGSIRKQRRGPFCRRVCSVKTRPIAKHNKSLAPEAGADFRKYLTITN